MKKQLIIPALCFVMLLAACGSPSNNKADSDPGAQTREEAVQPGTSIVPSDIHADPAKVVQEIFNAARSGDFSKLTGLCDPEGSGDGDTKSICDMANQPAADQDDFKSTFAKGSVNGTAVISGDEASVKIKFGPDGDQDEEFKLVKRNNKWYLVSI